MKRNMAWASWLALAGSSLLLAGCGGGGNNSHTPLEVKVLSSRPDMVSGGDALVEVATPPGINVVDIAVKLNGNDVSSAFAKRDDGRVTGVVSGLVVGDNKLVASAGNAGAASLTITNFPIGGPIISGPQIQPWICAAPTASAETATSPAINASGLSTAATDAQCNIKTETKLWYKSTAAGCTNTLPDPSTPPAGGITSCYKKYDPAAAKPADIASTTTDAGVTVPFIVRVERGTLNRGIYDIVVLFDPTKPFTATAPQAAWNGKLFYTFGSSTGQPRRQFRSNQTWPTETDAISRGFMVALNSLTDSALNSNRVMMSETVMMMKEHVIKNYGPIKFTMSNGCSGGSINQLTDASINPGLIDGILPTCTYPDSQTTGLEVADCQLLVTAYNSTSWKTLTSGYTKDVINAKKAAINGHMDQTGCHAWYNLFSSSDIPGNYVQKVVANEDGLVVPFGASKNNCQLLAKDVYDPVTNPNGIRCGSQDASVAIWGKVAGTNRARDTRDNVGIQYGLKALKSSAITAEEFVTLNEVIGGTDSDLNHINGRTAADTEALAIAYKSGIVSNGKQLAKTAILDVRGFDDSILPANTPPGNVVNLTIFGIHHIWRSFSLRDRLDQANGGHGNLVLWRFGTGLVAPAASGLTLQAFLEMDKWVTAIKADTSNKTIEQKVLAAKPCDAVDFCYLSTDTGFTTRVTDPAVCNADKYLMSHSSPRQVAGGSVSENILKCQLKPLDTADYAPATLTPAQIARMNAVFPSGVCDWSKPGVGQQDAISPLTYTAGPAGAPIPAAPTSTPL